MVSVSPRLRDSLDYEDPEETDPRLSFGFRSLSINSAEYEYYEPQDDRRPFAGSPDLGANKRNRKQRRSDQALIHAVPFTYQTSADGDVFRIAVLLPGAGSAPIECQLVWESSRKSRKDYRCLSYCWGEPTEPKAAILLDGFRFTVTENLYKALQCIRKPNAEVRIWIDQVLRSVQSDAIVSLIAVDMHQPSRLRRASASSVHYEAHLQPRQGDRLVGRRRRSIQEAVRVRSEDEQRRACAS